MIIFELDGVLADIEHRRHLIDPCKRINGLIMNEDVGGGVYFKRCPNTLERTYNPFFPDFAAYNEACVDDKPIEPVIEILDGTYFNSSTHLRFYENVQIWTSRCESTKEKTLDWLDEHVLFSGYGRGLNLKMRPIGDTTPAHQLKERWLNEYLLSLSEKLDEIMKEDGGIFNIKEQIDFVFESDPDSIDMYRRRGIFVFNCNQGNNA